MRKIFIILIILNSFFSYSQIANDSLISFIIAAEKVLITSHDDLNITIGKPGKSETVWRTVLKNGKPNKRIIKERLELDSKLKQELIDVISGQKKDILWEGAYCFWPHHTIFFYKEEKWSYIDLCFGCDHYSISKDLSVNKKEFLVTYEDWRKLETFFRQQNLNYKMPKIK